MNDKELQKEKIRARYKGNNTTEINILPAIKEENIFCDDSEARVAVYARVSTGDPWQTSSYELQKNYYLDFVNRHPKWTLVDIYADDYVIIGISKENLVKSRVSALIPFSFFERASTNSYLKVKIQ